MSQDSLNGFAAQIMDLAKALTGQLSAHSSPLPSVSQGSLESYPDDVQVQKVRSEFIDALDSLKALVLGPGDYFQMHVMNVYN